jgi:8-oxo-dGTP pyrophosphatase MutT (NUDIX family)
MKVNKSYGIALTKKNKITNKYEILFIKKRSSYAFISFTKGIYFNFNDIKKLFNLMTMNEKLTILSLDFNYIWFTCFLNYPIITDKKYIKSSKKFDKFFIINNNINIKQLIAESKNVELIWEIPKGYCDKNETPINSAIREFYEETNIHKSKYKILWDVGPVSYTFSDNNVFYNYIYYVAIMLDGSYIPKISYLSHSMLNETIDIKFLSTDLIQGISPEAKFMELVHKIIKIVKNANKSINYC